MKALVKTAPGPGLEMREVPIPRIGRHDVLIRVLRTGICGTDLHLYHWNQWAAGVIVPPRIIGHEFVGEVVDVGAGVGAPSTGALVSGEGHITCGHCVHCLSDARHLCAAVEGIGVDRDGVFAEFFALPSGNVWEHQPGVSLDVAAMFDAFGNAVHVADTFSTEGKSVLIAGMGPIGVMAAGIVIHRKARVVAATDVSEFRLDLARAAGVEHAVLADPGMTSEVVSGLGIDEGFDIGFEMSGSPDGLRDLLDSVAHGGHIAVLGLPGEPVSTDWADICARMLTIKGVAGRRVFDTWHSATQLLDDGFDPSGIVTHHFRADQYEKAFTTAGDRMAGKVVLDWGGPA